MKVVKTKYGEVRLRNIMIDLDGSNLEEGIEISFENTIIEVLGNEDLKVEEIEMIISKK